MGIERHNPSSWLRGRGKNENLKKLKLLKNPFKKLTFEVVTTGRNWKADSQKERFKARLEAGLKTVSADPPKFYSSSMDTLPDLALKKIFSFLDAEDRSCFIHLSRKLRHRFAFHVCLKELDSLRLDDGMFDVDLKGVGWDEVKERFWEGKVNDNLVDYVVSLYIQYCVDYSRNWRKGCSKRTMVPISMVPISNFPSIVEEVRVFGNLVITREFEYISTYRLDDFKFMAHLERYVHCFKDERPDDTQRLCLTSLRQYNSTVIVLSKHYCCISVFDLKSITKDFEEVCLQPQRVLRLGEHHYPDYPYSYDVNQHMIVVVNRGNVYMWPRVPADQVRSPPPSHILKDPFNMKGKGAIKQVAINNRFAIVYVQRSNNALFKWHLSKTTAQLDRSVKKLKCSRNKVHEFIISKDDFVTIKGHAKYHLINVVKDELLYTIDKRSVHLA